MAHTPILTASCLLAATIVAGCSADGGFGTTDTPPDGDTPDISGWTPIARGAASAVYEVECSAISTCTVTDEASSYDGDGQTSTSVVVTGGVGDVVRATFDVGSVAPSGSGVAAIELSSAVAASAGYGVTVTTLFQGEEVNEGCGSLTIVDTVAGTGGPTLVGCRHTETYDTLVLELTFTVVALNQEVLVIDVVTAAIEPEQ